jgi:hypothetical protein
MVKLRSSLTVAVGLACLFGAGLRPAAGDWLVTREGARIETRGAWKEKGKLVVFETADGKLSSLRANEVDLEASRQATADAERAKAAPPAPAPAPIKKKSVASITDKDVHSAAVPPAQDGTAKDGAADAKKDNGKPDLSVSGWQQGEAGEDRHVVITGTVHNDSAAAITAVEVKVQLFDESGNQLAELPAVLSATALLAGQQAGFRAEAEGFFTFASAKITPSGVRMAVRPDAAPAATTPDQQ